METLNWTRLKLLLKLEWETNKRFLYLFWLLIFVGVIVFTGVFDGIKNRYLIRFESDYLRYYTILGVMSFSTIFQLSFYCFRKKSSSITYLLIPATAVEKFFSKILFFVGSIYLSYTIIFFFGINLSIYIWDTYTLANLTIDPYFIAGQYTPQPFNYLTLSKIFSFRETTNLWFGLPANLGFVNLAAGLSLLSSIFYRKNFGFYHLLVFLFYGFLCVSLLVIASHLYLPDATFGFDIAFQNDTMIAAGVPLIGLVLVLLMHVSSLIFLVASYFKFKEREV